MSSEIDFQPLHEAAEKEIAKGLAACQLAVGRDGKILWTESLKILRYVIWNGTMTIRHSY